MKLNSTFRLRGRQGRAGGRNGGGGENCHAPPPPLASPFNLRREGGGKGRPRLNKRRRRRRGEKWGGKEREGRRSKSRERFMGMSFFPSLLPSPHFPYGGFFFSTVGIFFLKRGKLGVFRIGISNSGKLLFFQREGKRCFAPKSPPSVPFHPPLHLNAHSGIHEKCCTNSSHGFFRVFLFLNSLLSRLFFVIVRMADLSFSWRISICRIYWREGRKEEKNVRQP